MSKISYKEPVNRDRIIELTNTLDKALQTAADAYNELVNNHRCEVTANLVFKQYSTTHLVPNVHVSLVQEFK